ncbi:MAG: tyrosine--tRNA ligase [Candidatus Cloacimonetes bacterium]|nr:tyrosine--tRNA ligase [Candidatus Cloacimonadota bacterium]MBL7086254.1 tyrosine--tRNA ligase [Candidatus Cloacimonadota bacterium]
MDLQKTLEVIRNCVEEIIPENDLIKKLEKSEKTGKPLRIKYGIDPTGYDVHIGHMVPIRKMRDFQDLGHIGVIIIGDFTAQIGDPTGLDETRKHLSAEKVKQNAEKYMEQLYKILNPDKTEVRWQSEWFTKMSLEDVINLMSKFTLAQFMAHETFRKRYEEGLPLSLHELLYPLLQAYDSVVIEADVELGATEQKFNILAGRELQKMMGMESQIAILSPILFGTDGKEKMSKSLNNYIAIFDSPEDKYGKVMSIPDSAIINYFKLATNISSEEIKKIDKILEEGKENPKNIKMRLAKKIVTLYDGKESAQRAETHFQKVFADKEIPDEMPIHETTLNEIWIVKLLSDAGLVKSNGEARRMIQQGAVSVNGNRISAVDINLKIVDGMVIKIGKRRFCKIIKSMSGILKMN